MPVTRPSARSLLIVDDDDVLRSRLARAFRERGFEVREAGDAESGAAAWRARTRRSTRSSTCACPARRASTSCARSRELDPTTAIVVLTGYGSIATALEAVRLGATHYLTKPADVDEILAGFARAKAERRRCPSAGPSAGETPSLARVEWEHINRVLADCGGNISKAARALGIHRRSLQRKLSKFPSSR